MINQEKYKRGAAVKTNKIEENKAFTTKEKVTTGPNTFKMKHQQDFKKKSVVTMIIISFFYTKVNPEKKK